LIQQVNKFREWNCKALEESNPIFEGASFSAICSASILEHICLYRSAIGEHERASFSFSP